jgi:hypothetical protein
MADADRRVGKAAGRVASGGVPTIGACGDKMVGTAQGRLCPPYGRDGAFSALSISAFSTL